MPYVSVRDMNGQMIQFEVAEVPGTMRRAVKKFNAEQQRAYSRQHKADDRHLDDRAFESIFFDASHGDFKEVMPHDTFGSCLTPDFAAKKDLWLAVQDVLNTCTAAQQTRFRLWLAGYSYVEIAALQRCKRQAVWQSVQEIVEKLKKSLMTALSNGL